LQAASKAHFAEAWQQAEHLRPTSKGSTSHLHHEKPDPRFETVKPAMVALIELVLLPVILH